MRRIRHSNSRAFLAAIVAGLVVAVPLAGAATLTHDEYVARAEPICKKNTLDNARIFKGVQAEVKAHEFAPAAEKFKRAAVAFGTTLGQLAKVPKPPEDAKTLSEWFVELKSEKAYLQKISAALAASNEFQAQTFSVHLNRTVSQANETVRGFGFKYCKAESSRFT